MIRQRPSRPTGATHFAWPSGLSAKPLNSAEQRPWTGSYQWLKVDKITAVKLDVEGAELFALEGFQMTLDRLTPYVTFEWRPDVVGCSGASVGDITTLFPVGYIFRAMNRTLAVDRIELSFSDFRLDQPSENVLAVPPDHADADWLAAYHGYCVMIWLSLTANLRASSLLSSLAADRCPWLILEYAEVGPGVCLSIALVSSECLRCVLSRREL